MSLIEIIEKIVIPFDFSETERVEVTRDLITTIALAVVGQVSNQPESVEDVRDLKTAIDTNDYEKIDSIIKAITNNPNHQKEIDSATISVIESWLDSVLPTISQEKQEEVKNILDSLSK